MTALDDLKAAQELLRAHPMPPLALAGLVFAVVLVFVGDFAAGRSFAAVVAAAVGCLAAVVAVAVGSDW